MSVIRSLSIIAALAAALHLSAAGQRITILTPESSELNASVAEKLEDALIGSFRMLDRGAAESAFRSLKVEAPFNLTSVQARQIGEILGCGHFIVLKASTSRRTSSSRPSYFEAWAAVYLVNSRTGLLELWKLESKQGESSAEAEHELLLSTGSIALSIMERVRTAKIENGSVYVVYDPDNRSMRPAMPYRQIRPEYTQTAYLYGIAATVDAEVNVDVNGEVTRIDITRWAGFGLDESVITAIRQMNWRPGERNGKPLPMRVLLRYNFTKIEKEQ